MNRWGDPCEEISFVRQIQAAASHFGIRGNELSNGLKNFFDRCFDLESDRQAVIALRGMACETLDGFGPREEVDIEHMRRVLARNHPLSGPADKYQRLRGKRQLAKMRQNLPPPPSLARLKPGPAMSDDPKVAELLAVKWPDDPRERAALMAELREKYFVYLDELRKAKRLRMREVAHLLGVTVQLATCWKVRRAARPDLPQRRLGNGGGYTQLTKVQERAIVAEYRKRPGGQTLRDFCRRLRRDGLFVHTDQTAIRVLRKSGDMRRRRGRPRKRRTTI